jgi:hypothetical protein
MTMHFAAVPWLSVLLLGGVHGINPAMGWLFAVAKGLQERDRHALWRALGPLALGHGLAIAVTIVVVMSLGQVLSQRLQKWSVALALVLVGIDGLRRHRHVSLRGMNVNARQLATWSFLMASVHGAGLMVLPFVLGTVAPPGMERMRLHSLTEPLEAGVFGVDSLAVTAPLIHTVGYLIVTAALAAIVYEKIGLRILRRAWINVNLLWSVVLLVTAALTVVL